MNRCPTCRHWSPHGYRPAGDFGSCERISGDPANPRYRPGDVASIDVAEDEAPRQPAWLVTSREFGCVLWEEQWEMGGQ